MQCNNQEVQPSTFMYRLPNELIMYTLGLGIVNVHWFRKSDKILTVLPFGMRSLILPLTSSTSSFHCISAGAVYLGCFSDSGPAGVQYINTFNGLTVEVCAAVCKSQR